IHHSISTHESIIKINMCSNHLLHGELISNSCLSSPTHFLSLVLFLYQILQMSCQQRCIANAIEESVHTMLHNLRVTTHTTTNYRLPTLHIFNKCIGKAF